MAQGSLTIQTSGVLSGLALVNAINDALANLASLTSGSTDPSSLSGGVLPFSFWLDTSVSPNVLRMRNSANTAWAAVGTITGTNFVPNLENADISTALGYTAANKAGDTFTGDVFSNTKFQAPVIRATTKLVFADGSEQNTAVVVPETFPSGTIMLFAQSTAPTGWTKSTAHNNKTLRVVSGTAGSGGSVAFTSAFASRSVDNHTLTVAQMPSHNHSSAVPLYAGTTNPIGYQPAYSSGYLSGSYQGNATSFVAAQGGGGAHSHGINLDVQYVDVILAIKN